MFDLLKAAIATYRLYRCKRKQRNLEKQLKTITDKINLITLALKAGYSNETEFFDSLSKINRKLLKNEYNNSLEISRNITEKVGKAVQEYEGANNGQK